MFDTATCGLIVCVVDPATSLAATSISDCLVGCLVVYRITLFLHQERGPFGCAEAFRQLVRRFGAGGAIDCFRCLSVWVALAVSPVWGGQWLWFTLATSGGACVIYAAVEYWWTSAHALGGE